VECTKVVVGASRSGKIVVKRLRRLGNLLAAHLHVWYKTTTAIVSIIIMAVFNVHLHGA
jgi:hypothetical protein